MLYFDFSTNWTWFRNRSTRFSLCQNSLMRLVLCIVIRINYSPFFPLQLCRVACQQLPWTEAFWRPITQRARGLRISATRVSVSLPKRWRAWCAMPMGPGAATTRSHAAPVRLGEDTRLIASTASSLHQRPWRLCLEPELVLSRRETSWTVFMWLVCVLTAHLGEERLVFIRLR